MNELYNLSHEYPYHTYSLLLIIASFVTALFFRRQKVASMICLVLSIGAYFLAHPSLGNTFFTIWFVVLLAALLAARSESKLYLSILGAMVVFVLGALGILHAIPYYVNWKIYSGLFVGSSTQPYSMYHNLDKGSLGVLIYLFLARKQSFGENWKKHLGIAALFGLISILVLLVLLYPFGFIKWDPKIPSIALVWLMSNAFLVCMSEEIFFRGFIFGFFTQRSFDYLTEKERFTIGYFLSSALFGLYHYRLGWSYMFIAFVAGLLYGWVYHKTKRIEYSTLTHIFVNAAHFFFFSYPILKW